MGFIKRIEGTYNPHQVEEEVKRFWNENRIYEKLKNLRKGRPKFYFLDGPPYVSAPTFHIGTARNKCIKDVILRFKRMRGYDVWDKPGYDCHGLPIEIDIEKRLRIERKKDIEERIGLEKFILMCKQVAIENSKSMTELFKELGIFMDWDSPYMTLDDNYIEAAWWLIKKIHEMGLLKQELRVLHWCPRCETVLADYEVSEYQEIEDPSIYVKFKLEDEESAYLIIWTTTPWTLPANTFIMIKSDADYVKIRVGNEYYILAKARLEEVMKEVGIAKYEVVEEFKGKDLVGRRYRHPLEDIVPAQKELSRYHVVIAADEFVTLTEGTGLVHAAPGHGEEDQIVALRHNIPIVSLVDERGRMTKDAGKYAGLYVRDVNEVIIRDLKERGALLHASTIVHRYPVCWRCKTPLIFRATKQWIIKMSHLKSLALEQIRNVKWVPPWTVDRMRPLIEDMRDWVISRQRYWGTPLPIWVCTKCNHIHVIGSKKELLKLGAPEPPKELHRPWVDVELKCPKCGGVMRRVPDVVDVWFDSGISFYASLAPNYDELWSKLKPVDFIVEGHDQTRGWFFSLLRAGLLGFNEIPYSTVLLHGFMLDELGREMHKSLGNVVDTKDVISSYGRDPLRLWILQTTTWEDVRYSPRSIEQARRDLNVAWNVFVFASSYMSLDNFDPEKYPLESIKDYLRPEDRWILSRLAKLCKKVTTALDEFRIHEAARAIREFIVEDVSHWYIRLIRRRVWEETESPSKIAAYATLYKVLKSWLILAAPIIPFITEYLYQRFVACAESNAPESIHMSDWIEIPESYVDEELETEMDIIKEIFENVASIRMRHGIKLRQPLPQLILITDSELVRSAVKDLGDLLRELANVTEVKIVSGNEKGSYVKLEVEPVMRELGKEFRSLAPKIVEIMNSNPEFIAKEVLSKGEAHIKVEDKEVVLTPRHVKVVQKYIEGFDGVDVSWGTILLNLKVSEAELTKGLARDIVRRIQVMRKELRLELDARINVVIVAPSPREAELIRKELKYISEEVRAKDIVITTDKSLAKGALVREWEVDEAKYLISISPTTT